jgi:hypothetical protein
MNIGQYITNFKQTLTTFKWKPRVVLYVLLALASAMLLPDLYARFAFEWAGPINFDTSIYFAVAQGILNGLVPYKDLFEPKPPGIFLIIAYSNLLFGSPILGNALHAFSLVIYPLALMYIAWIYAKDENKTYLLFLAGILGGVFGLYSLLLTGSYQTEPIGALFGLLYILCVVHPAPPNIWRILAASAFILAAVGTKEPFLLTLFASVLLLNAAHPRELLRRFLLPLCIAAISGVIILALLGWLDAYLNVYIAINQHEIVFNKGRYIPSLDVEGLLTRLDRIVRSLASFSPALPVLVLLLVFAIAVATVKSGKKFKKREKITISAAIVSCVFICLLAVGVTYYYRHHSGYLIPFYVAVCIVFLRSIADLKKPNTSISLSIAIVCILIAVIASSDKPNYDKRLRIITNRVTDAQKKAARIDKVMDKCSYDRYMFVGSGGFQPYGFTRHSPLGPSFIQGMFFMDPEHRYLRRTLFKNMKIAPLIYIDDLSALRELKPKFEKRLSAKFTQTIPECAANTRAAKMLEKVYYRIPPDTAK